MGNTVKTYLGAGSLICSLGFGTDECAAAIRAGKTGIREVRDPQLCERPLPLAAVDRERLAAEAAKNIPGAGSYLPLEQMMILAVGDVIARSGVDPASEEVCFVFSTTKGNVGLLEGALPDDRTALDERVYLWNTAERVAGYFGSPNRPVVVSNACVSGVSAVIAAARLIREGRFRHAIVCGGDVLTRFIVSGFDAFKSLSAAACRPFDASRDGLTLGEACAAILVSSDARFSRGVVIEGGASSNDANHISGPSRTGDGLALAIEGAMRETGLAPSDISFVNAHGTATPYNDEMEAKALSLAGLEGVPVNGLKSYIGHTLGAAGVAEIVLCAEQLAAGVLFGTKGYAAAGTTLPPGISASHREIPMKRCLKTASGFGGCNAAVVLALEGCSKGICAADSFEYRETARCVVADGKVEVSGRTVFESEDDFGQFIRAAFKALERLDMKFYKMDDMCKLGYIAAGQLLNGRGFGPSELALVLANRSSSLDTDIRHQRILDTGEAASPSVFVYTLPNVALGEICIRHGIKGENTFFIAHEMPEEELRAFALQSLGREGYRAAVYGWCEQMGENYRAELILLERKHN